MEQVILRLRLLVALCGVRCRGQIAQECEERLRLANEESHGRQKLDRACGYSRRLRRTDYRTHRQSGADKWARFWQDQVCLEHPPDCGTSGPGVGIDAAVEIGECQSIGGVGERGHITIHFGPGLKMNELNRPHADEESQHLHARRPLCQRQAQTAAALFNRRDMEGRRVGDGLNVFMWEQVIVCARNGRKLPLVQIRDRLLESGWVDVGIIRAAPITRPPTGVHG